MSKHQRMASIFWLIIGICVAIAAFRLGLGRLYKPGPGFIFFITGSLLALLSIIDLAGGFVKKQIEDKDKKEEWIWRGYRWEKVLLVLGGLIAYVYFFDKLGFLLSTFLLMVFLFKGVEPTRWWVAIGSSLATTLVAYAIFRVWLRVPFPPGIFDF